MMLRSLEPLICIMGNPLIVAQARAVSPFRNPGADTVRHIPGFRVRNPLIAAAFPADCSWRNPMYLIPTSCARRARSVTGIPTTPKIVSTPFIFSASTIRCMPSVIRFCSVVIIFLFFSIWTTDYLQTTCFLRRLAISSAV